MNKLIASTLLGAALLVSACVNTDLDTLAPINSIPADGAINNRASAVAALNGVYSTMQENDYDAYLVLAQIYSDEADFTGTFPTRFEFNNLTVQTSNTTLSGVFSNFYDAINVINNVLVALPEIDDPTLDEETRTNFLAELKFLRALNYWYLVNYHGEVPIILDPTREVGEVLNVPKSSVDDVYAQIISDLQEAEANLTNTDTKRATSTAASALLARVYLYRGEWANALAKAELVLGPDFDLTQFPYLQDEIFFLGYTVATGNALAFQYGPSAAGGREDASPSQKLLDAFEEGDIRRDLSVDDSFTFDPDFIFTTKYNDYAAPGNSTDPVRFIRHAEMVLIAAEAAAELEDFDKANGYYNQVRARAGLGTKTLDASNYVDLILQERFVELSFEGPHRFFDLRRRGRATQEIPGYQPCNDIWPIPQRDIDRNPNLNQNGCCTC